MLLATHAGPGLDYGTIYADDPLWDGEGCGATNACCQFNNPPWFCTTLPQPTTDDIEMRLCSNQGEANEDVVISFVNINIMRHSAYTMYNSYFAFMFIHTCTMPCNYNNSEISK